MNTRNKPVLVTGGCGFVGRHLTRGLLERGVKDIWLVDDLSTGRSPREWVRGWKVTKGKGRERYTSKGRTITLVKTDAVRFFRDHAEASSAKSLPEFGDVFHLASIVGGRSLIEGDPILVATDLAIDALFFLWATRPHTRIGRILYASSSASYPTNLQGVKDSRSLEESLIDFDSGTVGTPDLTYGWSKLTGEYLSKLAHRTRGLHIACVRPFSGYGEDQDLTYPTPSIALRVARGDNPIEVWGTGKQGRDFIHIDDCIDAFFPILDKVKDGSGVNIGTGKLTSFTELIETMLKLEGKKATIKPLTDKPVGVAARYGDVEYLNKKIGWKPKISLDEGLRRVLEGAHARLKGVELPFHIV